MEIINCTFDHPGGDCPNCGGALTPTKYYTAVLHQRFVQPRRKSPGYNILSYSNVLLHNGGLCVQCGRNRSMRFLKSAGIQAVIWVAIVAALTCFGVFAAEELPSVVVTMLSVTVFVLYFVCLFKIYKVLKWLFTRGQLGNEAKLTENRLSSLYAKLSPPPAEDQASIFPITAYDYLQKEHKG